MVVVATNELRLAWLKDTVLKWKQCDTSVTVYRNLRCFSFTSAFLLLDQRKVYNVSNHSVSSNYDFACKCQTLTCLFIIRRSRRLIDERCISLRSEEVQTTIERIFSKVAVWLLDLRIGTIVTGMQQSGVEDKLNDVLIREVNSSIRAVGSSLGRDEDRLSGPSLMVIFVVRRILNTSSLERVWLAGHRPVQMWLGNR